MTATPQPQWHSIRPWTPRLSLSIREITSVSATFILASTLTGPNGEPELSLSSLGLVAEEGDEEEEEEDEFIEGKKQAILSDALAKGFSINVNGVPWQRVLIRIDDKTDEAVIIIYGLMPGRQYDIDLGLVHGAQKSNLRRQVTTEGELSTRSLKQRLSHLRRFQQSDLGLSPGQRARTRPPSIRTSAVAVAAA
jgi:hypothetical protein